jgi:hypothetical protein
MAETPIQPVPFTIYRAGSVPPPPAELAEGGAELWRSIMAEARFRKAGQLEVLRQACRARDRADRLRREIELLGDANHTAAGDLKSNPLLAAEAIAQNQVVNFLRTLGVLVDEQDKPRMGRPPNQRPSF